MFRRASLAALFLGVMHLAGVQARAASDYDFGMALMKKFQFDDVAEKFFKGLAQGTNRDVRLTGKFGLGGIKKLRADRTDNAEEAARLYVEAKALISEFLRDASNNHPERSSANTALVEIEKRYLKKLTAIIKNPTSTEEAKKEALGEARTIFERLLGPLREDKIRAFTDLKRVCPWPEKPSKTAIKAWLATEGAMARYYGMVMQQAELFQGTGEEGKTIAKAVVKEMDGDLAFCGENNLWGFEVRLNYELGRAHVAAGDLDSASRHFDDVLSLETTGQSAATRQYIELHQLYAYYKKANAYFDVEKWGKTIEIVDAMFDSLPQALNESQGNGALLLKAKALYKKDPPDYAGAVRVATKVIEKRKDFWPDNANRLMAKVLGAMEKDAGNVSMSAEVLHGVAMGEVQIGYRQSDPAEQRVHFEKAIYWLQKTITATRSEGAKLNTRLLHGPTAWFEMGSIYARMNLWYEARFSFEAVLRYSAKDVVGRMLAADVKHRGKLDQVKEDIRSGKIKPADEGQNVNEYAALFDRVAKEPVMAELLGGIEKRLKKSANNLMYSARRRHTESRSEFDRKRLDEALIILIEVDPSKKDDIDFHRGLLARAQAEGYLKTKDVKRAVERYEAACELFLSAAKAKQSRRELAYHLIGVANYQVMSELGKAEVKASFPRLAKRAPEFGERSLKAFAAFMKEAAKYPDATPEEKKKRDRKIGTVDVARPVIYMVLGKHKEAVAAADEFLARKVKSPKFVPTVMWTRVRALRELAIQSLGTRAEARAVEKVIKAADKIGADIEKYKIGAQSLKAAVYSAAAAKLRELAENARTGRKQALLDRAEKYARLDAEAKKLLIRDDAPLSFLLGLADEFFKQKAYVGAREIYVDNILAKWDPNGTGQKMVIAENAFELAAKGTRLSDFKSEKALKTTRVRIKAIKLLVFGEPIEQRRDKRYSGLIHPSKKMNWAKAYNEITEILREAPRLASGPELKKIADELVFRIQMLQVKLNLADCDMALARRLVESNPEEAGKLFDEAARHIKKVREYYWRDNELRFLEAEAYDNLGRLGEAQKLYAKAARKSRQETPNFYRARIAFSKIVYRMGEAEKDKKAAIALFRNAMGFPYLTIKTSASEEAWVEIWPEAAEFVAQCEAAIQARGENIILAGYGGEIKDDKGYDVTYSPEDLALIIQINIVDNRIKSETAEEKDRQALVKEAFEVHLSRLPDTALQAVAGKLLQTRRGGGLTKKEGDLARRRFFVRFLYQSPFQYYKLPKLAVELGILESESDAIPVRLLSKKALKVAKKLGYVTKDDQLVPRDELSQEDRDLLRRELGAVEEDEASEDGAAPVLEDDGGLDAEVDVNAPAEEVAP